MTIEDFFRLSLRYLGLLLASVLVCAVLGAAYAFTREPVYQASALGYVSAGVTMDENGQPVAASTDLDDQRAMAGSYLPLVSTRNVAQRVIDQLGIDAKPGVISKSLSASVNPESPVLTVTAKAATPQRARDLADAAVAATAIEAARLQGVPEGSDPAMIEYPLIAYQPAVQPTRPVSPDKPKIIGASALIGLVLGYGLAWLRGRFDTKLRTGDDLAKITDAPVLGVVPRTAGLRRGKKQKMLPDPQDFGTREALRKLRTNLRFLNVDDPPRCIVITSPFQGEGKSTVAGNLARVLARSGRRTVLVDADLRRPVVADEFGVDGSIGLTQVLSGTVTLEDAVRPTDIRTLGVLPAGQIPPNPSELLGSHRMGQLIQELGRDCFVLIDSPPLLPVTDATLLTVHSDGAIVVAAAGQSRAEHVTRALRSLRAVNGTVLGLVLNMASSRGLRRLADGDAEYGYGAYGPAARDYTPTGGRTAEAVDRVGGRRSVLARSTHARAVR